MDGDHENLLPSASDYVCVLDIDLLELVIKTWKGSTEGRLVSDWHQRSQEPQEGHSACPCLARLPPVSFQLTGGTRGHLQAGQR